MKELFFKRVLTVLIGSFALCEVAVADMELGGLHECYMFSDDRMIYKQPLNKGFEFSSCYMAIPVCGVPSGATITPVVTMGTLSGVTGLKVWTDKQMVDYYLADWNKGNDDGYPYFSDYDGTLGYETSRCSYEIDGGIWDIDEVRNRNVTPRADRRWILFKGKIPKGEWGGMKTFTVGIKGTDVRRGYAAYSTVNGTLGIRPGDFFNRVTASGYDTRYDFALEVCDADAAVSREYAGCEVAMGENYLTPLRLQIPEAGTLVYRGVSTYVLDYIDVTGGFSASRQTIYPADDKEALNKFGGSGAMETRWQFGGRATLESQLGILYFTQLLFFPANAKSVAIVSLQADYDEKHGVSVLRGYVKGSGTFKAGETARLTAVSGGALFKGWEVVYGALPSGVDLTKPTLSFTVPESMCGTADEQRQVTVRAVWVDKPVGRSSVSVLAKYNTAMGKVTGTGSFASGKKITLKATANKGFVFAGWYKDASFGSTFDGEVDYRTPSFPYVVGVEDATVYAKFMPISDDVAVLGVSAVEDEYAPKAEIVPISIDVSGCVSLPTVTVKGLPPGLKFTAKALDVKATKTTSAAHYDANTIYGTPTKSGVYETVITVTTAGKKTATETVKFVVIDRMNDEHVLKIEADTTQGKVVGAGIYAAGKKVSLKATAAKGCLFAGWYEDADCTQPLTGVGGVDHRTQSLTVVMPDADVTAYAKFVNAEDDVARLDISYVENEYPLQTEIAPTSIDVSGCVSLPTVTVKGLPPGLKFTAKALDVKATKTTLAVHYDANTIYGTPTKSGVYDVTVIVTTLGKKTDVLVCPFVVVDRTKDEYILKLRTNVAQGKVTGAGVYAAGKKVALKAMPNKGFVFAGWYADERLDTPLSGDGGVDYRTPSLTVVMPNSDAVAYAAFVPPYMDVSIALHVDGRKTTDEAADTVFNTSGDLMLPIYVKSASLPKITLTGLPSGLKFTTKRLLNRDGSMLADANTVYGIATKPGTYVVTAKLTNATVKKALERRFTIVVDNLTGAKDCLRVTGADGHEVSLRNGRGEKYMVYMGVADHGLPALRSVDTAGKVTLAGLPAGLKYDAKTGKITGAATKVGTYTVTVTVRSGRDSFVSTFTVEVAPLPEWAVGTFVGAGACRMASYESFEDNLYGTVTIAASGKISGKILFDTYEERLLSATFSSSAIAEYDEDEGCFYCDVDLVFMDGWNLAESRRCRMRIEPRPYDGTDAQTVGDISIDEDDFSLSLTQNVWKLKDFAGLPQFAESKTAVSCERKLHGDPSVSGTSTLMLEIDSNGMVTATLIDEGMECGEPLFESNVTKGELLVLSHMSEPDCYQARVALVFGNFGMLIADIEMRVSYDGKVRAGGCSITHTSDFADWSR